MFFKMRQVEKRLLCIEEEQKLNLNGSEFDKTNLPNQIKNHFDHRNVIHNVVKQPIYSRKY